MLRKILFFSVAAFFAGWLVFGLVKFSRAAQAPILNSVTTISSCGFNLSFNSPEPASRFEIQTSKNQAFTSPNLIFDATDENGNPIDGSGDLVAVTFSELLNDNRFYDRGARYYFRIKMWPAEGGGPASNWSNVDDSRTNVLNEPAPPENLTANGQDGGQRVLVSWEWADGTPPIFENYGGFEIWRAVSFDGGATYGNFILIDNVPALDPGGEGIVFYDDNNNGSYLNPVYSYKYYLKSYQNDYGCRENQKLFSVPSGEVIVPVRPDGLLGEVLNPNTIRITWNDNSRGDGNETGNETGFEIWREYNNEGYVLRNSSPADATSFIDNDVQPRAVYRYKIKSCRFNSCSDFSNFIEMATGAQSVDDLSGYLFYVRSGVSGGEAYGNVRLDWTETSGDTYTLLRKNLETGEEITIVSGNGISPYEDLRVPLDASYEYKLRIENGEEILYSNVFGVNLNIIAVLNGTTWAWASSSGVGWIKFRSDEGAAIKYSVQIDLGGAISGTAWSSNYGWLSFNERDLGGCPAGLCEARIDLETGELSGWGKFTGWGDGRGWFHLKGANYGVALSRRTGGFSGTGWGGEVLGWLPFACSGCSLSTDLIGEWTPSTPVVSNVTIENGPPGEFWCSINPFYRILWNYSDPENNPQTEARIQFLKQSDDSLLFPEVVSPGPDISYRLEDPLANIDTNTEFYVKVRVSDGEFWSEWTNSQNRMETPSHLPPLVDFSWLPARVVPGEEIVFTDGSSDRSGGVFPPNGWTFDWLFGNGTPEQASGREARTTFSGLPADVSLTVQDQSGMSCGLVKSVGGTTGAYKRRIFRER